MPPLDFGHIRVLVVGDVMLDRYWYGDVERISPEAPVPVARITRREERAGGAANVAVNVRALGAHCELISVVGDDEAGNALQGLLEHSGISLRLSRDTQANTTVKLRVLARNQQLLRADFEDRPNHEILAACLDEFHDSLSSADVVIVSDYGKGGLLHIQQIIELCQERGVPVLVDPKGDDFHRYRGATILTPNLQEFETVAGRIENDETFAEGARDLVADLDLEGLLVTRSDRGMTLFSANGEISHSPAQAREVYDVSGAGDTVISAFAVAYGARIGTADSLRLANVAAGIVVGKLGTASATIDEVRQLLAERD